MPNSPRKLIKNAEELKKAISAGHSDFAVALCGGLKSCKSIHLNDNRFTVQNHIDGSTQKLSESQIMDKNYSNIGKAMLAGSFYIDE